MYEVVIKKRVYYLIIVFFIITTFLYKNSFPLRSCTLLVSYVTYPFLYSYALLDSIVGEWRLRSRQTTVLKETIEQLEQKNNKLQAELITAIAVSAYADAIQELRLFKERYNVAEGIIAQVLQVTCTQYEQTIMVNAGFHHGVVKNMVVLAHNCLVGKVVEVFPWYAKVRLITDARCKVSVLCATTGAIGIHQGNNTELTTVEHVSHLDTVKDGDMVISTGKGLIFPQGFALGRVLRTSVNGLVQQVAVQPLFTPKALCYCLLVSKELCEKH